MTESKFIHLKVHSEYSLIDGLCRIKPLVEQAAADRMPAIAITEQSHLFSTIKFYRAAVNAGIKPIIGADLWLQNCETPKQPYLITLLCQDYSGYLNLTKIVSRSYLQGQHQGKPIIQFNWLPDNVAGLIALSGAQFGNIGQLLLADKIQQAEEQTAIWQKLFPNRFYLELQRTGRINEEAYIQSALTMAQQYQLPVVATNDVRFLAAEDFVAHEARVCIHDSEILNNSHRPKHYSQQQYLRTPQEMQALFADIPEALANTVAIAKRCNVALTFGKTYLPSFPVPKDTTIVDYLSQQAEQGLAARLEKIFGNDSQQHRKPYDERLTAELKVINSMGFAGYFLIVADFIAWAREHAIPVGPGRGSGAGSLVSYALNITDLDPLQYDLLFERFLNPERVSMPDFDIDFCMENRDRVIEYVADKYGHDSVAQIITYGSMAAKAVVRDVGRVLGHPYGFVDKIAKLIPFELGITLDKALIQEEILQQRYEDEEEVRGLIDLAKKLEGIVRNAGTHAGGVVIAPSKLTDFVPLYCEAGGENPVTQFDKDDVEAIGLVKFDLLGLRTLTIIDWAVASINYLREKTHAEPFDITKIAMDDADTFTLLKTGKSTAIFQLESRGMKDLINRLQPDAFEDIIALVALFRPGPLQSGMVDDFIDRKHGRAAVAYPHPDLENILKPTYGVILYQEQVMQIAQTLANYTLGAADLLRRAMGKKKPAEMAKQKKFFIEGAVARGVNQSVATSIFDLIAKFAGYGFNKSHSAGYALLSYQTAFLKTHYPAPFMAAALSSDMDNTDKVFILIEECRELNLKINNPDINQGYYKFSVPEPGVIIYGLGAVKGVGKNAVEYIVQERKKNADYQDLFDFCQRVDNRKVNRRALENLIRCGSFDELGPNRASLSATIDDAIKTAEQQVKNQAAGQSSMFDAEQFKTSAVNTNQFRELPDWNDKQRLAAEKESLGYYICGHPIERYRPELQHFITANNHEFQPQTSQTAILAGQIVAIRAMNTKKGDRMAFVTLDDNTGKVEFAVFPESYQAYRELLLKDQLVVIEVAVKIDSDRNARINAQKIFSIDEARKLYAKNLLITINHQADVIVEKLQQLITPHKNGTCPVWIDYQTAIAAGIVRLGKEWCVKLNDDLLDNLIEVFGSDNIVVEYF